MAFAKVGNIKGPKGDTGAAGATGATGAAGAAGQRGNTITTGSGAPTSTNQIAGDLYIDVSTGDLYQFS